MIDSKELRIGNKVSVNKGFEMTVVAIFKDEVYLDFEGNEGDVWEDKIKYIEPIPLTEKLLNRCKFNFKDLGFESLSVAYGITKKDIYFVIGNYYKKINYFHQLQNLYSELTEQELTLKP